MNDGINKKNQIDSVMKLWLPFYFHISWAFFSNILRQSITHRLNSKFIIISSKFNLRCLLCVHHPFFFVYVSKNIIITNDIRILLMFDVQLIFRHSKISKTMHTVHDYDLISWKRIKCLMPNILNLNCVSISTKLWYKLK